MKGRSGWQVLEQSHLPKKKAGTRRRFLHKPAHVVQSRQYGPDAMTEWKRKRGIGKAGNSANIVAKSYTVPATAADEIRKVASLYGSQGRALLAATEILIRLDKPPDAGPPQTKKRVTFRLHTRTVQLIQTLSETNYGDDPGQVFSACVKVLKMKKIKV